MTEEQRERARERQRRYRTRHLERVRATARDWAKRKRAVDPEAERAYQREWAAANPEKIAAYARKYRLANPEKRNEIEARRRALKRTTQVEKVDRARIIERDGCRCHICGKKVPRHRVELDHLIPLSKGGPHTYENLAVAHPVCNRRRKDGRLPAQLLLVG